MALRLARVRSRKLFAPVGVRRARIPMHARNRETCSNFKLGFFFKVYAQNNSKDVFIYQQSILFHTLVILKSSFLYHFNYYVHVISMHAELNIVSHSAKKYFHKHVTWSCKAVLYLQRTDQIMKRDRVANGKLSQRCLSLHQRQMKIHQRRHLGLQRFAVASFSEIEFFSLRTEKVARTQQWKT